MCTAILLAIIAAPRLWAAEPPPKSSVSPWVPAVGAPQYFAISVEDVDRSVAWYRSAFALDQLDDQKAPDGKWRIVNLASDRLFVEVIWDSRDSTVRGARGFAKVGFGVEDVDAIADRIEKATGTRPRVIEAAAQGVRILQLNDPDGNIIQISSPLRGGGGTRGE